MNIWWLALAPPLLAGLLWAEAGKRRGPMLLCKGALSALFVLTALLAPSTRPDYYALVLAGLVLGLIGDLCLALPGLGPFRAGLAAFLLGHLLYVAAFARLAPPPAWLDPWLIAPALAGLAVFFWLRPRAGRMLVPVTLYIAAISLMLAGAWAVFRLDAMTPAGAWCVLAGAVFFYLSDLCVARDRFVSAGFVNRLVGLPLYYAGQFLLAWSTGLAA